ncbi:MAG: type II toxin-antitoxin system VapC family toxin [Chitinophagaceae bacterium]
MTDNFLIDTNAVIIALQGNMQLKRFLQNKSPYLSFISEIELFSFSFITHKDEKLINEFISQSRLIEYNSSLKPIIISLRKTYKLKMADSIIAATALHLSIPILTYDKGFKKIKELNFREVQ